MSVALRCLGFRSGQILLNLVVVDAHALYLIGGDRM